MYVKIKRQEYTQNTINKTETRERTKTADRADCQRTTETEKTLKTMTNRKEGRNEVMNTHTACRYGSAQRYRPVSLHQRPQMPPESNPRIR
jgi:hypothetical protein